MVVREKQIGRYRYVYLVESVRENGRIKRKRTEEGAVEGG
jgi:hypothetical protein